MEVGNLQNLFNLEETSELNKACGHKSVRSEQMLKLKVDVTDQQEATSLLNCLNAWVQKEDIPDVSCDICNKKGKATKQLKFGKLSNYLVIQLGRFGFSIKTLKNAKFSTPISFPKTLELSEKIEYLSAKFWGKSKAFKITYNLRAFIIHNGSTPNSGHYWAYGQDKGNHWWRYEDSSVTDGAKQITEEHIEEPAKTKQPVKPKKSNPKKPVTPIKPKIVTVKIKDRVEDILKTGLDNGATPYILFYELDDASRKKLEELKLLEPIQPAPIQPAPIKPDQPNNQLQQKLAQLKISLQELKAKLQTLQGKLGELSGKLGK